MLTNAQVYQGLKVFANMISQQPMGLALHCPEQWALPTMCFGNTMRKVELAGGRAVFGWMFLDRTPAHLTHTGYLIAIHHSVWCNAKGYLFDVTPFHDDPKHHPVMQDDGILFLVDSKARPVQITNHISPLPSRFFPLTDDPQLADHVKMLRAKEEAHCSRLYDRLQSSEPFDA